MDFEDIITYILIIVVLIVVIYLVRRYPEPKRVSEMIRCATRPIDKWRYNSFKKMGNGCGYACDYSLKKKDCRIVPYYDNDGIEEDYEDVVDKINYVVRDKSLYLCDQPNVSNYDKYLSADISCIYDGLTTKNKLLNSNIC